MLRINIFRFELTTIDLEYQFLRIN